MDISFAEAYSWYHNEHIMVMKMSVTVKVNCMIKV